MAKTQALPLTEAEHTAVYRFFNAADELLYVGITGDPRSRWVQHAAEKAWWPDVVRHTVQWLPSREAALAAEAAAIVAEAPLHNVAGTPRQRDATTAFHGEIHESARHPALAAVRAALRALERIEDFEERALVATALLREWPRLHREVREVRQDAVFFMAEGGMSYTEIGRRLGVGGQRAAHIAQGK
ncbi:GIY-YIG nuclease family protein [Streptomyces albogriseolus]|uniref:GIY-YIG nuclease family protein n=1 Tax=Streptomyces albogriseolus TaxID=1887 RepID=UPI0036C385A5